MPVADKGMGRGLAAILPQSGVGEPSYREIPTDMIQPNPDQPRKRFDHGLDRGARRTR